MLSSPVVRKSSLLTDKLLHLLSIISVGQSALKSSQQQQQQQAANGATPDGRASSQQSSTGVGGGPSVPMIGASHLKLAVEVLTSKSCSEEGLEDVTNLLSNLSYGPESTRDTILLLLLQVLNSFNTLMILVVRLGFCLSRSRAGFDCTLILEHFTILFSEPQFGNIQLLL